MRLLLPLALLALAIVLLMAVALRATYLGRKDVEAARLQAVAELRSTQITQWLDRRMTSAAYLAGHPVLAQLHQRHVAGDELAGRALAEEIARYARAHNAMDSRVLTPAQVRAGAGDGHALDPPTREAALRALAEGRPQRTDFFGGGAGAAGGPWMDVVVPLPHASPALRSVAVMRFDLNAYVLPALASWPQPSGEGRARLVRLTQGQLVGLSGRGPQPLASSDTVAARVMRGEMPPGQAFLGRDPDGQEVLGLALAVPGTDWYLSTSVPRRDLLLQALRDSSWSGISGLLALLLVGIVAHQLRARQALKRALRERAQQVERLQAQALLAVVADSSGDAILAMDAGGRILSVNGPAAAMLGRPAAALAGQALAEVLPPEVAPMVAEHDRLALAEGRALSFDERFIVDGQSRLYLSIRGPLRDAEGRTIGSFCIARDVTDRHQAELARDEATARRRFFFDHSRDAVFVVDMEARVLEANPAFLELLGYSAEEAQSLHIWDFDLSHPRERALAAVARELPVIQTFDARWQPRRGPPLDMEISINRVEAGDRRVILCVARDVTARKQTEQRLRKLSLAVEQSPSAIVIMDSEGRIEYVNEAYERISGYRREEVLGGNPRLDASRADSPEFHQTMIELRHSQQSWSGERIEYRRDGQPYHERLSVTPLREADGSVTHYVAIEEDISERKRIEAELVRHREHLEEVVAERTQALLEAVRAHSESELRLQTLNEQLVAARDRAEAANRAKTAFLANMSHEIRTPMNAIIGLTHLMQREQRNPADAERLGKVSEAAHHLLDVINDVLDLSKIESGKLQLEHTGFSVDAVLSRTCALVAERAQAKGLEIVIGGEAVPAQLVGDPTRLSQALLNILSNAVKFTEEGWVLLRCEPVGERDGALKLRFSVTDTGVGIQSEKLGQLFQAFEQVHSSTNRRFGGTGLGLAITRRHAELMGGEVGVDSREGEGSCFWFTAWLGRAPEAGAAAVPAQRLDGLRALLVDDAAPVREQVGAMLAALGLQVDAVADGAEAMARLAAAAESGAGAYDLLVTDWPLPGADASALNAARLRAIGPQAGPRCVLLCRHLDPSVRSTAALAGFETLLAKPVTMTLLRERLQALLRPAPAAAPVAARRSLRDLARPDFGGAQVLLAEDNSINQEVAVELLRAVNLRVDVARNGSEAVERAHERDYALILMDVQMPVLDGLEATRAIRALPDRADTPILAMTANAFGDDRRACLEAGMNDHIGKPVDPQLLYAKLARWLPPVTVPGGIGEAGPARTSAPVPLTTTSPAAPAAVRPDAANAALAARLAAVPGLTMSRALLYLPGRDEVFVRVLRQFADNNADALPTLQPLIERGELREARALVHALRGTCGAVGATALQEQAQALEQLLEQQPAAPLPQLGEGARLLRDELATLVRAIGDTLAQGAPTEREARAAVTVSPAALRAACDELRALLAAADFSAGARLRELAPVLRAGLGAEALARIEEPLRRFDHEAALAALGALPEPGGAAQ